MESDTESDSSGSQPESQSYLLSDHIPEDFSSPEALLAIAQKAQEGISIVETVKLDPYENDITEYERIHRASGVILALLDAFISSAAVCMRCTDMRRVLCSLLSIECLDRLFHLRQIFHIIASQEARGRDSRPSTVCWVDIVLSTMGDAVMAIVSDGGYESNSEVTYLQTLSRHRNETSLCAALQLPHNWCDALAVISSEFSSPAAVRLSVRLALAAYVLPQGLWGELGEPHWPTSGPKPEAVLKILRTFIHRSYSGNDCPRGGSAHVERSTYAMIISIYAAADSTRSSQASSPLRPHTAATLLSLMRYVMAGSTAKATMSCIHVVRDLDVAQSVMLQWGITVPWAWRVWNDERVMDYHIVEYMTSTWLYHLGKQPHAANNFEDELFASLSQDPTASSYITTILLNRAATAYRSPLPPSHDDFLDVVFRCCLASCQLLEFSKHRQNVYDHAIAESYVELFVYVPDDEKTTEVKNTILVGLTYVDKNTLEAAIRACIKKSAFRLKLEDKAAAVIHTLPSSDFRLKITRQTLQFLILAWHSDVGDLTLQQSAVAFLRAVMDRLSQDTCDTLSSFMLLDSLITAITLFEINQSPDASGYSAASLHSQTIFEMALTAGATNIAVISAFACFISATIQRGRYSVMNLAEAWDLLRDFLLLICHRHFFGADEPLSLLICPAVCRAMQAILQHADVILTDFLHTSPWTVSFCDALKALLSVEDDGEYNQALREFLSKHISALLNQIRSKVYASDEQQESVPVRSLSPSYGLSCLTIVPAVTSPKHHECFVAEQRLPF